MQVDSGRQTRSQPHAPSPVRTARYVSSTDWNPLPAIVAAMAILAVAFFTAYAIVVGYDRLVGLGGARGYLPGEFERLVTIHQVIHQATFDGTIIILTLIAARYLGSRAIDTLALRPPPAGVRVYLTSLLILAAAAAVWFGVFLALLPQEVIRDIVPYRVVMARELSWLMALIYCLLAPVAEELLFRGFLFPALMKSRAGFYGAAIVTSAAWAGLHFERSTLGIVQLFAFGMLLCWLLVKSGSLRIPILCHVVFNLSLSFIVIILRLP